MLTSERVAQLKAKGNANKDITGKSTKIDMSKKPTPINVVKPKTKPTTIKKPQLSNTRLAFNKAFAAARKSGASTFTFRGKSYTTKLK